MRTRSMTHALVGAAALLALAGCATSAASGQLEPAPGELDYDVAVTRAALQYGVPPANVLWDPWANEGRDLDNDYEVVPLEDSYSEAGMESMCSSFDIDPDATWSKTSFLSVIGDEAIRGAVVSQASPEFREAASTIYSADSTYGAVDEEARAQVQGAQDTLSEDLYDEWVELHELQTSLHEEVYSVEGAQAAQEALAERCDATLDDTDAIDAPLQRINPDLVMRPFQATN